MEKPSWSASPLSSRWKYSLLIDPAHGAIAPSPSDFSGSGTTSSGSTSLRVPMPVHSGQAPKGELNENDRGSSASRSEEHTSELQSRQYLVCRLLLEKKKKIIVTQSCLALYIITINYILSILPNQSRHRYDDFHVDN